MKKPPPSPAHVISPITRRGFLGAIAAAAGASVVVRPDRPAPPEPRLLAPKIRWIGHL